MQVNEEEDSAADIEGKVGACLARLNKIKEQIKQAMHDRMCMHICCMCVAIVLHVCCMFACMLHVCMYAACLHVCYRDSIRTRSKR